MPHTHPKYQLAYTVGYEALHQSGDATRGTLDEALAQAAEFEACCQLAGWDDQHYYVMPVPGTEPRYMLHLHWRGEAEPNPQPTSWHALCSTVAPLPYLAARDLFEQWSAESFNADHARLVMVPA